MKTRWMVSSHVFVVVLSDQATFIYIVFAGVSRTAVQHEGRQTYRCLGQTESESNYSSDYLYPSIIFIQGLLLFSSHRATFTEKISGHVALSFRTRLIRADVQIYFWFSN